MRTSGAPSRRASTSTIDGSASGVGMDKGHALRLQSGIPEGDRQVGEAVGTEYHEELPAGTEKPRRGKAEVSDVAHDRVTRHTFCVAGTDDPRARTAVGRIGKNRVQCAAGVAGRNIPHVGKMRNEPVRNAVFFRVSPDEIRELRLDFKGVDARDLFPCQKQQGNDARPASEVGGDGVLHDRRECREQIRVGTEGQSVGLLNETDFFVDLVHPFVSGGNRLDFGAFPARILIYFQCKTPPGTIATYGMPQCLTIPRQAAQESNLL